MKTKLVATIAVCVGVLFAVPAIGQGGKSGKNKQDREPVEFIEMYNRRHLATDPKLDTVLKEVEVFDSKGNAFSTAKLRGKYSVLVFGCLT